jgi:hypothetical protein
MSVLIAVLVAALVWMLCVALHLPSSSASSQRSWSCSAGSPMSRKPRFALARRAVSHVVHKSPPAGRVRDNTAKRLSHLHGEDLLKECARVRDSGSA